MEPGRIYGINQVKNHSRCMGAICHFEVPKSPPTPGIAPGLKRSLALNGETWRPPRRTGNLSETEDAAAVHRPRWIRNPMRLRKSPFFRSFSEGCNCPVTGLGIRISPTFFQGKFFSLTLPKENLQPWPECAMSSNGNGGLPKRLFSLKEASVYLGRTVWAVREMLWAGKLPFVRDGKRILLDIRDMDRWIEASKTVEKI